MATFFGGTATIYAADGVTVTIAGTARGNLTKSLDLTRPMDHIVKLKNRSGKMEGYIVPEDIKEISVTITPGAASLAGVSAATALPGALAKLVIASCELDEANGTYVLDKSISGKLTNTDPVEFSVSGTFYTSDGGTETLATQITS